MEFVPEHRRKMPPTAEQANDLSAFAKRLGCLAQESVEIISGIDRMAQCAGRMEQAPLCQSVNRHWVHPQLRRGLGAFESLFLDKNIRFRAVRLTMAGCLWFSQLFVLFEHKSSDFSTSID